MGTVFKKILQYRPGTMPLGYPSPSADENYHMVFALCICMRDVHVCACAHAVSSAWWCMPITAVLGR